MAADCKTKSKRFFQQPSLYDKARPEYSRESVKFLLEKIGAFSVAADQLFSILEVGVGTGKFTRVMCEVLRGRSVRITASDSNPKMCQAFHVLVPGVEIILCPTERIDVADENFDAVIAAQSFHWFANEDSISEIHRVLKPGGSFGMIWNPRDFSVSWVQEIQDIINPLFKRENIPDHRDNEWKQKIHNSRKFGEVQSDCTFRLYLKGGADVIVGAYMGLSAIAAASEEEKQKVESKIRHILATDESLRNNETYSLPYVTDISWCAKT